jgi:hypothetical protein
MNSNPGRIALTWLNALALILVVGLAPAFGEEARAEARECSLASLKGTYGTYRFGTNPAGPVAAQGIVFVDGNGNYHVILNNSRNGEIFLDQEFEGTYRVEPDCTGAFVGDEESDRFVIIDNGSGVYAVSVFDGVTVTTVGTRTHPGRGNTR